MRRGPMPRGKGFKRKLVPARAAAQTQATCGFAEDSKPVEQRSAPARVVRRGTYTAPAPAVAIPKTPRRKIPHLLRMARGMPCLFEIVGVCNHDRATTVAAHSNWVEHGGKSLGRKADDCYSAWACSACHAWLDSGPADGELKKTQFLLAHLDQVLMWREIASGITGAPAKDRAAAALALEHLNATPVGRGEH